MRRFIPITATDMGGEARNILSQLHFAPADAPDFLKLLARSLTAMRAFAGAETALAGGELTPRQREQIALAVAEINGCAAGVAAHTGTARRLGLTDEEIHMARDAKAKDASSNAMLAFVLAVVLQRGEIKDEDLAGVREEGFSESQIIEITANIAINIFRNYLELIANIDADRAAMAGNGNRPHVTGRLAGKES